MTSLVRNLRFGLRLLGRNLGFTSVALLALTLGIGALAAPRPGDDILEHRVQALPIQVIAGGNSVVLSVDFRPHHDELMATRITSPFLQHAGNPTIPRAGLCVRRKSVGQAPRAHHDPPAVARAVSAAIPK